jgi:hypothetical protein
MTTGEESRFHFSDMDQRQCLDTGEMKWSQECQRAEARKNRWWLYFALVLDCWSLSIYLRGRNGISSISSLRYLKGWMSNAITVLDVG